MAEGDPAGVMARLCAPFEVREVKFKPQSVKGNRALAMAYIDCRVVQDRLDDVVGVENWQDSYEIVPDGSVVCWLAIKVGGEWITKTDVGSPSEQPDGGDRLKAAFSDALKRAAVKFGIGRYLYRLPAVWTDYDPQKKQFVGTPQLPMWALPKGSSAAPPPKPQPQQPAPRWTDQQMDALIQEKNWTWQWVVGAINKHHGASYADANRIPDDILFAFMDDLKKQQPYQRSK